MKRTTSLRTRVVAMFLAAVCIVGLIPTTAFAAGSSVPQTITLKNADYHVGEGLHYTSGTLGECYIHEFTMNVDGSTQVGFCGDHSKEMGTSLIGDPWSSPTEITDKNVKLILSAFYSHSNGMFTEAGKAAGCSTYNEFETIWTQGWYQACVWLALQGDLPDYETNPDAWVEAVATERMRVINAYHDAGQSWAQHYENIDDPDDLPDGTEGTWTCRAAAQFLLNNFNSGYYLDWTIYRYSYAGNGSDKHAAGDVQSIIVGFPSDEPDEPGDSVGLTIRKVDSSNQNKGLQGAQFSVVATDGSFDKTYTTDSTGTITIDSETEPLFKAGTYIVTETKAPAGYTISDPSPKTVTVLPGNDASVVLTFYDDAEITGSGSIRKVDKDNPTVGLAGAVIEIRGIDVEYGPTRVVTGAGGYVSEDDFSFQDLPIGSYICRRGRCS